MSDLPPPAQAHLKLHTRSVAQSVEMLASNLVTGLSTAEAHTRHMRFGPNALREQGGRSPWRLLWEQFSATMVVILIVAAVISAFLGKWLEASAILAIVLLFALLG